MTFFHITKKEVITRFCRPQHRPYGAIASSASHFDRHRAKVWL